MNELKKYVSRRKISDPAFSEGYEEGYQAFKIGALLRQARENKLQSGLTPKSQRFPELKITLLGRKIEVSMTHYFLGLQS